MFNSFLDFLQTYELYKQIIADYLLGDYGHVHPFASMKWRLQCADELIAAGDTRTRDEIAQDLRQDVVLNVNSIVQEFINDDYVLVYYKVTFNKYFNSETYDCTAICKFSSLDMYFRNRNIVNLVKHVDTESRAFKTKCSDYIKSAFNRYSYLDVGISISNYLDMTNHYSSQNLNALEIETHLRKNMKVKVKSISPIEISIFDGFSCVRQVSVTYAMSFKHLKKLKISDHTLILNVMEVLDIVDTPIII